MEGRSPSLSLWKRKRRRKEEKHRASFTNNKKKENQKKRAHFTVSVCLEGGVEWGQIGSLLIFVQIAWKGKVRRHTKKGREQSGNKARYKIMTRSSVRSMVEFSHREIRLNRLTGCVQHRGNGRSAKALGMPPHSPNTAVWMEKRKEKKKKTVQQHHLLERSGCLPLVSSTDYSKNLRHDTVKYHNLQTEPE